MKKDIGETLTGRRESLDILRGLAAVLIFVFHFFALYPSGQIPRFEKLNHVVLNYFSKDSFEISISAAFSEFFHYFIPQRLLGF